jgi:hypothetical protein
MARRRYTDEQLLAILQARTHELGRVPTQTEIRPSYAAYVYRFGSWANAIRAAGLTPRKHGGDVRRALVVAPKAPPPADIRTYWLAVDPKIQSLGWTHPYARRAG